LCTLLCALFLFSHKPGVVLNSELFHKKEIHNACIIGGVRHIQTANYGQPLGNRIAILGQELLIVLSCGNYRVINTYSFRDKDGRTISFGLNPSLVDIHRDGSFQIMKGGGGYGEVGLLDDKGNTLWSFQPDSRLPPFRMISGDLDGDNRIEFYVADRTGLYKLDHHGNIAGKISKAWISDIKIISDSRLPCPILIALTRHGEFMIFNADGRLLRQFTPGYEVRRFDIVNWPDSPNILVGEGFFSWNVHVLDLNGKDLFRYKLSTSWSYYGPQGLAVRFNKENEPYLVVLGHAKAPSYLTQLNIFSPSGALVYQEILHRTQGLCSSACANSDTEKLIIGNGNSKILEYSMPEYSTLPVDKL
jgi:hypothetical protein